MKRNAIIAAVMMAAALGLAGCRSDAEKLYEEVKGYVPAYAVMAHRGSTYWAPEETESAWRWARETGADYLESDLQCTKDGIILANHDVNLTRTTDIEEVFGADIPASRKDFYVSFGFGEEDA
ncbi:MAG: glycerophosphodiester phosphodiesterase, partial [Bacteroidales bacterium]|nr:glycerophosphodiester phosphodiesterase [Bacteroidales bacterium]